MKSKMIGSEKRSWTINGRFLAQPLTGVQRYAREIVAALDEKITEERPSARALTMRLVVPPAVDTIPSLATMTVQRTRFGSGHAWDQLVLPSYTGAGLLSLGNFGPVVARNHIVCIHDANTFTQPDSYSRSFGTIYRALLPMIGKRAGRIATVSKYSADMLVKYGISERQKIFIAPNGHEHALRWNAAKATLPILTQLARPYVLLLGSRAKHKNIEVILGQADRLKAAGIDIVVSGAALNIFSQGSQSYESSNIRYVGYVGDDDLAALYERALCLVFPSKTEGFGIPPLEAMTRGCPVISSSAASLKEVGGDAVIYVDPDDVNGWGDAIIALANNSELRAKLASYGRLRAISFSWKASAQLYFDEMVNLSR